MTYDNAMLSLESSVHYFTLDIGSPHLACISLEDTEEDEMHGE